MFYQDDYALTYDDVLIVPQYSEVLPTDVVLQSKFSKNVKLNIPVASSAMDTVTESPMAIAMALEGGIGVIHKNFSMEEQALEVKKVKEFVDIQNCPNANLDKNGKLIVAAACGVTPQEFERAKLLISTGVDVIVIDTAHGHSLGVIEMVKKIKAYSKAVDVVAGNVATLAACTDLINAGADGIKVGIGPGSICTTRVVAGIGVPQLQALIDCAKACIPNNIPFIADGGIKHSGEVVKAIASGASCVMLGSMFAATDESPGDIMESNGKKYKNYRGMGSMGAMEKGSKDRYGQAGVKDNKKLVPEGIEGMVPYQGNLHTILFQLCGGLRAGMGYVGASNVKQLHERARFIKITQASLVESHPHDVMITVEAPNYKK
jgi:IMP dehydrogenase